MEASERLTEFLMDSTWAAQATELFASELRDLEQLEEREIALFQQPVLSGVPEPNEGCSEIVEANASVQERRIVTKGKKNTGASKSKVIADSLALRSSVSSLIRDNTNPTSVVPAPEEDKNANTSQTREQELWWQMLQNIKQQIKQTRQETDYRRLEARRQLRFFTARPIDEYVPDDIVNGAPDRSHKAKGESIFQDLSFDASGKVAHQECFSPGQPCSFSGPTNRSFVGSPSMLPNSCSLPPGVDLTIDATTFMSELNAALEKEYGFRTLVRKECPDLPREYVEDVSMVQLNKLSTHRPGDLMEIGKPQWRSNDLPFMFACAAGSFDLNSAMNVEMANLVQDGAKDAEHSSSKGMVNFPLLRNLSGDGAQQRKEMLSTENKKKTAAASSTADAVVGDGSVRKSLCASTSKSTVRKIPLDCSATNNTVSLRTTVGVEVATSVRFCNRGSKRIEVRLKTSENPWLTYTIVKSTTGKLIHSSTGLCVAVDTPLSCGDSVDVRLAFKPESASAPSISEVLQFGYCHHTNSRQGEGGRWEFFEVSVLCETQPPSFRLIPAECPLLQDGSTDTIAACAEARRCRSRLERSGKVVEECKFPYTFVLDKALRHFMLENTGSDAVITLSTSTPNFKILTPSEPTLRLRGGHFVDVTICFTPLDEMHYHSEVFSVTVRDAVGGPVLDKYDFGLCGEGVLPHIEIVRVGELELSTPSRTESSPVPQYFVPETTPDVESRVEVMVRNSCPIAVPYFWETDVAGGGHLGALLSITPTSGSFPPHEDSVFVVMVKPSAAQPIAAVLNLFLEGLPKLPLAEETAALTSADGNSMALSPVISNYSSGRSLLDTGVRELLSCTRMVPVLPDADLLYNMVDPCSMFHHCKRRQDESCRGLFASGFYLFANPLPPSLTLVPDRFEECLECLVHGENARRIVLQNHSELLLHFYFNPEPHEVAANMLLAPTYDPETVELKFMPRTGVIQPRSSVAVTFTFALLVAGHHSFFVNCYVPELMELTDSRPATADSLGMGAEVRCTHGIHLSATAIGPSLRTSTTFLDFGLIEHGRESETTFTVTNDNPIPVAFELRDPKLREPPRFVFIPQSFCLGAGESAEVTVYRQAVKVEESQIFFELAVQGGTIIAIETRATIQAYKLVARDTVVNYGVVPNGVWVQRFVAFSNPYAFDIPYAVHLVSAPPNIRVCLPKPDVARAGCLNVTVPVLCAFSLPQAPGENKVILCIKNRRREQEIFVELFCDTIQELAVALDLIPVPKATEGLGAMAYAPPMLPSSLPPPLEMDAKTFIESFLWNLVELAVLQDVRHNNTQMVCTVSSCATPVGSLPGACNATGQDKPALFLRPYCPPVFLRARMPDKEPVWSELMVLCLRNLGGCHSTFSVKVMRYGANDTMDESDSTPARLLGSGSALAKKNGKMSRVARTVPTDGQGSGRGDILQRVELGKGSVGRGGNMGPAQPTFWCTSQNGTEQREWERRAALVSAQEALLDGRGCATVLGSQPSGLLNPHAGPSIPVSMFSNLPGCYEETLVVHCGEMHPVKLPVTLELYGKPVLLDPTTAGFVVSEGKETLLMPPVLAGVGRSQRTVRLVNRVPRDLNVCANIFLTNVAFSVAAVDEDEDAGNVTLRLQPMTEEDQLRESKNMGKVSAKPSTFFLPAMGSQQIVIAYAPDVNYLANGQLEREWYGSIVITAEIAETPFNDAFLIDEFYRTHPSYRPVKRIVNSKQTKEQTPSWMKSILQPISMLKVHKPLITRANVVKNSLLIIPQVVDPSSVRGNGRLATGNRSSIVDVSSVVMCDGAETDSSDVDDWPLTSNVQSSCGLGKSSGTSVAPAVTNMDERVDILEFMERRRRELAEQSRRYFVPIELELRALCGMARLTVEPSEHLIRLPAYVREQRCTQMILLINKSCAMMSFLLELSSPSFSIASTRLASLGDTYDELEVEDEEVLLMRRAMENLKWCRLSERLRARRLVRGSGRKEAATKGGMEILLEEPPTGRVGAAASTGESGYVATKYQLCPHDELEVIIEYNHPSVDELSSLIAHTPTVEATLDILFLPSDTPAPKVSQSPVKEPKQTFHPPPVLELRQSIPLLLTLSKLPESTASPC